MGAVRVLVLFVLLLVSACAGDFLSIGPHRPPPSDPATGPVVREAAVRETVYRLHDEGDGCVAVEILHPGLTPTVERLCFRGEQVVHVTSECGWLAGRPVGEASSACDVELPIVLFGRVTEPNIAHVCVGAVTGTGGDPVVSGARFLDVDSGGFILEPAQPGEGPFGHLFTAEGLQYGEPPLDAPSEPISRACSELAPWGETGMEYYLDLAIYLPHEVARNRGSTLVLDVETGRWHLSADTARAGEPMGFLLRVSASSTGIGIGVEFEDREVFVERYPWPESVAAILRSGEPCHRPPVVRLDVDASVLAGRVDAVQLSLVRSHCG